MNNKPCENCRVDDHNHIHLPQNNNASQNNDVEQNQQTEPSTNQDNNTSSQEGGVTTSLPQTPSTGSVRVPNSIQGEIKPSIQETSINADNVVEDNLVEQGEYLAEENTAPETNMDDSVNVAQSLTTEKGESVEPKTEEESIFNENPNENNKALTA